MPDSPDLASIRFDNAMRLFDEFVRATVRQADAATLRGLERRFAERLQIQPSYWSQIKARSRQIGERLARQFEKLCRKPAGWLDEPHDPVTSVGGDPTAGTATSASAATPHDNLPADDDERFIVGLVLTYYRRHPQRARTRLLELLGEVLVPAIEPAPASHLPDASHRQHIAGAALDKRHQSPAQPAPAAGDDRALWLSVQRGIAPLKPKR